MIERFTDRESLVDALLSQKLVCGNASLAEEIVDAGTLAEVRSGEKIITQGDEETDVFFILAGAFDVCIHGRKVARRFVNDHVGEMAAIQPTQKRSATLTATETSVVFRITAKTFNELGKTYPSLWRSIARELPGGLSSGMHMY